MTSLASILRDREYCCICQPFPEAEPGRICQRFIMLSHHCLSGPADLLAYSLLPDHFHLLMRRREGSSGGEVEAGYRALLKELILFLFAASGPAVEELLRQRTVSGIDLFSVPPVIACLHIDPEKHGISRDYRMYTFSSYRRYLLHQPAGLAYTEVFSWFSDVRQFERFHEDIKDIHMRNKFRRFHAAVPA
ncbi:hypothetical protein JXO52_12365 [bacterium]|nr:hypothetical protein [bacterium]